MNNQRLINQLEKYDLNENEAQIYLLLLKNTRHMSVVQIGRSLSLGRTPVYNAMERLEKKGLIKKVVVERGYNYAAHSPHHLKKYWGDKAQNIEDLASGLSPLVDSLQRLGMATDYQSQVTYYSGQRGLEQITYNSLRADGDLYIYEIANMGAFINQNTAEKFRQTIADRRIVTHQLTNSAHLNKYTRVEKMIRDLWDIRYIDPEILKIQFETVIYNDVVAMYSYVDEEPFGVEIKNPNLASMQIQIFKAIQRLATPMEKVDNFGATRLPQPMIKQKP